MAAFFVVVRLGKRIRVVCRRKTKKLDTVFRKVIPGLLPRVTQPKELVLEVNHVKLQPDVYRTYSFENKQVQKGNQCEDPMKTPSQSRILPANYQIAPTISRKVF
jgi:hypothetical protein